MAADRIEIGLRSGTRLGRIGLIIVGLVFVPGAIRFLIYPPRYGRFGTSGVLPRVVAIVFLPTVLYMIAGLVWSFIPRDPSGHGRLRNRGKDDVSDSSRAMGRDRQGDCRQVRGFGAVGIPAVRQAIQNRSRGLRTRLGSKTHCVGDAAPEWRKDSGLQMKLPFATEIQPDWHRRLALPLGRGTLWLSWRTR